MTAQSTTIKTQKGLTLNQSKGFTLIELLVTIAIIAIISVVAVALFGNIQADARDGKRKAELESIANALEVNKVAGGNYNPISPNKFGGGVYPGGGATALDPQSFPYCISFNATGAAITDAVPANFVITPTCNVGGTAGYVLINGTDAASAIPANTTTTWKICTRLENKGTAQAFCRTNTQ